MRRLLVLRPEPGASATVAKARERGLKAEALPLFRISPVDWQAPETANFDGLLLTSANAVRCGGEQLRELRGLTVYAVGEATAEAAREAGFDIEATGDGGVVRLLGSIEPDLKLLHLCGADRREPDKARQEVTPIVVYRSEPAEADLLGAVGAVALVHSPRAGRRLAELAAVRSSIAVVSISPEAAAAVGEGWEVVVTPDRPNDEALLALAARLCEKPDPE